MQWIPAHALMPSNRRFVAPVQSFFLLLQHLQRTTILEKKCLKRNCKKFRRRAIIPRGGVGFLSGNAMSGATSAGQLCSRIITRSQAPAGRTERRRAGDDHSGFFIVEREKCESPLLHFQASEDIKGFTTLYFIRHSTISIICQYRYPDRSRVSTISFLCFSKYATHFRDSSERRAVISGIFSGTFMRASVFMRNCF